MDRTQLSKGLINHKDISLFVLATVVSINDNYFIIDAGSKVFSSDLAPHSSKGIEG
jgi:D-serine deaminase-like pyridoxal phosphate-dependent protein